MTEAHERLRARAESPLTGALIVVASGLLGLLVIGRQTLDTFYGGGADMAHHYELVYWFSHHWSLPPAHDVALAEMSRYPPAAHVLAALVGDLIGSPFRGMQVVALAGIVLTWCAIGALLTILPGRRRWVALAALAVLLLLDTSAGPLRLDVHGFEIVSNFFFAEAVGQAIVWWLVWLVVRRRIAGRSTLSTAALVAIAAVLSSAVHLVPAVELLILVGCLCAAELLTRWRAGLRAPRFLAGPVALPAATALALVLTPGFRAMRTLSANNGSLDVPYLSGLSGYIVVAVAVALVSLLLLVFSAGRRREAPTGAVLQGLGFVGLAIAAPCLLQSLALAAGQGSPYAVKKYIFGLLTVLLVDACAVAAAFIPRARSEEHPRTRASVRFAAAVGLAVVAVLAVFSHPGANYSVSAITTLESHLTDIARDDHLEGDPRDAAIGLPGSDPVLDYMFSLAVFAVPSATTGYEILQGQPDLDSGQILTGARSAYASSTCRRFGPSEGLVVVDAACWQRVATACRRVDSLGEHGTMIDPRLRGFSFAEPTGRWTDGTSASFTCGLVGGASRKPVTIEVDATAFVPLAVSRQRVTLAADGRKETFVFTPKRSHAVLRLVVPPPASGRLKLTLMLPDAVSPHDLGLSVDSRVLGLFISRIRID